MTEYFTFRTRQGHKAIAFDDSSVILTEKTAEKLGLSVGDSFEVETTDGGRGSLTLTGITENYMFTRLYLSQAQLESRWRSPTRHRRRWRWSRPSARP